MAKNNITPIKKTASVHQAFSFEVTMMVQVLADDAVKAREHLDSQGGYVTKREVTLAKVTPLFNGEAASN